MIREEFEQRFASLTNHQEMETTALADEYRKDVTDLHDALLRMAGNPSDQAARARSVLGQLAETAVPALVKAATGQQTAPALFLLFGIVNGIMSAENEVTRRLKAALTDTRIISHPPDPRFTEEALPPCRVCDEAYVGLRRILNPESFLKNLMETRHFLSMPETERNLEIELLSRTGAFIRFLEDVDDEEA